jgi:hypothetical protein
MASEAEYVEVILVMSAGEKARGVDAYADERFHFLCRGWKQ